MNYRKICSLERMMTMTVVLATMWCFSVVVDVFAIEVHSKDSLSVYCGAKIGVTFHDIIKLKPGESKSVSCFPPPNADINLKLWDDKPWMQVFYCNHDNWLTIADTNLIKKGTRVNVECVEP